MTSSEVFQHKVTKHLLQNDFESAIKNKDTNKVKECLLNPEHDVTSESLVSYLTFHVI